MTHVGVLESNLSGSGFEGLKVLKEIDCHVTFFTRDVDRYLEVPGAPAYFEKYVDEIVQCETNVLDELLPYVNEVAASRPFHAFLTLAEYDVVVAAQVAVALGLRTVSVDGVAQARNKVLMRRCCAGVNVPMPDFRTVQNPTEAALAAAEVGLPCVVKPADETSSADVRLVETPAQAAEHVALIQSRCENTRGQSRYHEVLVEEYLSGPEVSVEVLAEGDRYQVFGVTDKTVGGQGYFVEVGHSFPSSLPEATVTACGDLAVDALRAVGFDLGMAHVEIKVTNSGPKLVEINPRPAGGKITCLVDQALGIRSLELVARQYLGQTLSPDVIPARPVAGAAIRYLVAAPGRVTAISGKERAAQLPGVLEVMLKVKSGDVVSELRRNGDRLGHVLVVSESAQLAQRVADAAAREIIIRTEPIKVRPVADSLGDLIGGTPLLRLSMGQILDGIAGDAPVLAKLENFNPWSSSKDRAAFSMLNAAEERGMLTPGGTVIEATSGNTGISLAALAACRGYKCVIVLPDNATPERVAILRLLGASVIQTPYKGGYQAAVDKAAEIRSVTPGSWFCCQHDNPDNVRAHYESTGPELWADTDGRIDVFVCGVGTGGTISGAGRFLQERSPALRIVAVEPKASPVLSGGEPGTHSIPGFNGGFIAPTTDRDLIDEVIAVSDTAALETTRRLAQHVGLMVGISSGAVVYASGVVAARPENRGKRIVTLLPDTGERYLSVAGYQPDAAPSVSVYAEQA